MTENHDDNEGEQDINNGHLDGFATPQLNIDSLGKRADAYSSFLKAKETARSNLVIVRHAQALKILFDGKNKARGM